MKRCDYANLKKTEKKFGPVFWQTKYMKNKNILWLPSTSAYLFINEECDPIMNERNAT